MNQYEIAKNKIEELKSVALQTIETEASEIRRTRVLTRLMTITEHMIRGENHYAALDDIDLRKVDFDIDNIDITLTDRRGNALNLLDDQVHNGIENAILFVENVYNYIEI